MSLVEEYNLIQNRLEKQGSYMVKVKSVLLNVRQGPGYESQVAQVIAQGEQYIIIEEKNNWGKLKELNGWVCLDFVEKIGQVEIPSQPEQPEQSEEESKPLPSFSDEQIIPARKPQKKNTMKKIK